MDTYRKKWICGDFLEKVQIPQIQIPVENWIEYESYMKAYILYCENNIAALLVDFPPEASEDNALHCHPKSHRCITVLKGSGEFYRVKNGILDVYPLSPGNRIWMPRGVLHTFKSGAEGMLVKSIHDPFIPLDHPHSLVYPKKNEFKI